MLLHAVDHHLAPATADAWSMHELGRVAVGSHTSLPAPTPSRYVNQKPVSNALGPFPVAAVPVKVSTPPAPTVYSETVLSLKFATYT
jgi:hypothetical protein